MSTIFIPKHIHPTYSNTVFNDCLLFHDMTPHELDRLENYAEQSKCEEGEYLFRQDTPADFVYNVISGSVAIERIFTNGRRQIIGFLFPGDFIGLTHSPNYDCAVRCLTKVEFYKFSRKRLNTLSEEVGHLKQNMEQIKSAIFSRVMEQLYVLGQKKALERLCFLFMQLLERLPGARADRVELYMSRQDMADYLGLTIETVSRCLAKLKSDGLVAFPKLNHLQILNLPAVSELAEC
ncbi:helix-turn-helix domain-containing protein [Aliiglaciecola sp. 3_MG-2023]|uniref:Crp/Fnr family transcriptional regulator n=1 Tax=Aliiglaciecola sp. 3_MG-2023 TaxID=3062644 RepID=UPI0026E4427F|nr:cyclic nucleotide-binding domain-containing protein [Aliiglaciecola sp. 3_MG-2023]MDO6693051.1 helix-turn-helix domain-containing protein [Aliiglaciecola sp. 3_MG-2023]